MDSWTISKVALLILIRGVLLAGSGFSGIAAGVAVFYVESGGLENTGPLAGFFGLAAGVAMFCAGLAGRAHVSKFLTGILFPPSPDPVV